ncbi:MAG TPA: hypothetical protein VE262_03380 [Blastocatellia bacterium]|nr:hypothetical protein [Blastocatellia bacterium]
MGVEGLSRRNYQGSSRKTARVAALCALLPGMGAVYNRQNLKAIAHFVAIVGLFQLAEISVLDGFFGLAGVVFYFYSILDAYRTARLIAEGESAAADEEQFKRMLVRRAPALGLAFIVVGLLVFIQIVLPFRATLGTLIPVALVILGGYLLTRYFKRSGGDGFRPEQSQRLPYSLVQGAFGDRGHTGAGRVPHKDLR